ncbi:NUDIX domain-containing protein [Fulvivirga ligni]|uniref:NUDIX domain-containing protein n=1 Tax=Fulvivirga ligni TaxID=2904246 RepID=UPI001F3F53D3|nr:NUDIX domain-containing protein [Fulvivirga ligni]UII19409.1 NUDIX domain-containing protein [Fulvivirga ligni]
MATAVIIARFQTPYLHEGHIELINHVKTIHSKVVIVLGVAPITGSRKNPFDYYAREKMIKSAYPEVVVLPLSDHSSDVSWSSQLDALLRTTFPTESFILYGSRDSFIPYYHGHLTTQELPEYGDYNATELRKLYADQVSDSRDFRAGILYAYHHQYPKVYPTVDIAVFRNDRSEILLAKKEATAQWRLPGGFTDPTDNSYEEAANRELKEECGGLEIGSLTYETSQKINDWRYRNEVDQIITTLYSCDYMAGTPTPQDDIQHLRWFQVDELMQMIEKQDITEEHSAMLQLLAHKYTKSLTLN